MSNTWKDRKDLENMFAQMGIGPFARRARAENLLAYYDGKPDKVMDRDTAIEDAIAIARRAAREG